MYTKQLLTFEDVADELACDQDTVRSLVVEERSLPAVFVMHTGSKEPYPTSRPTVVGAGGLVFDANRRSNDLGYLRVRRVDLDGFMAKHGVRAEQAPRAASAQWPNHETKKLTALRLAALKFWSNYDPAQPDTAPTNETVIAWLRSEHSIGATPAAEMASILRPESLRTGPR